LLRAKLLEGLRRGRVVYLRISPEPNGRPRPGGGTEEVRVIVRIERVQFLPPRLFSRVAGEFPPRGRVYIYVLVQLVGFLI